MVSTMDEFIGYILLGIILGGINWKLSLTTIIVLYVTYHWRRIYILIKVLPRDVRFLYRMHSMLKATRQLGKENTSVVGAFRKQLYKNPRKPCFYFEDKIWSYENVEEYSNQIANVFLKAGYKKGDAVALMMNNCPEYVCIWLGLAKLGVCTAFINTNLRHKSLLHCIHNVSAKAVIYSEEFVEAIKDISPQLLDKNIQIYQIGGEMWSDSVLNLDALRDDVSKESPTVPNPPGYSDNLLFIYTSGTTGLPKAAFMPNSRFLLLTNAVLYLARLREDDIIYNPLPMYHASGGAFGVAPALVLGIPVVIRKKFSASSYFSDCVKYKCTVGNYIGEMCRYILVTPPSPADRLHRVRIVTGVGMRPRVWVKFVERFKVQVIELYGATEGNVNMGNLDGKVGAVGCLPRCLPMSFYPMAIVKVSEDTNQPIRNEKGYCIHCQPGEPGMLIGIIKQLDPTRHFHGYVDPEASKSKIMYNVFSKGDKAFVSGDLVVMDEEGYIYFKDRTGDTFRWKGENVSTAEVETIISEITGFKECAVYGVQVGELEGRAGMAAIADPNNELDFERLVACVDKALPAYARPVFIRVLKTLPVTGTFKLQKTDLQRDGFNPVNISDKLYVRQKSSYVPITEDIYNKIVAGEIKI